MLVHGNAQYFSELYGPHEDQASSYPSEDNGSSDEAKDKEIDVGSSNESSMQDDKEASDVEAERLQVRRARGKAVASAEETNTAN